MARKILRLAEIHDMTGIPVNTIRYHKHTGTSEMPLWKLAGRIVAYEDEMQTWLDEQRAKTSSTRPAA